MTRRYDEDIEVRLRDGVPDHFLRRGRVYLVQEVLAQWSGTGAWWRPPVAATALAVAVAGPDLEERDYWRVVARPGRLSSPGVFELCFECSRGRWTLARAVD